MKTPRKHVFHTKITWKTSKNLGDANHFQKQTKRRKIFLVWSIYGWAHTSHLNMYNHINEISIHWTLDLCVVCMYQMWNSPLSKVKLQWSIQSSHKQLVLSQVVYLNYRNEHIWPPTRKWLHLFEAFHLAYLQFITFDHFWTIHFILRLMPALLIFHFWE